MTNARAGINTHYWRNSHFHSSSGLSRRARRRARLIGSPGIDFSLMETETHKNNGRYVTRNCCRVNKLCASNTHTSSLGEPNEPIHCAFSFSVFHCGGIDCAWCWIKQHSRRRLCAAHRFDAQFFLFLPIEHWARRPSGWPSVFGE